MALSKGQNSRVVLVAAPMEGHITPMLQLASILHGQGFSITIAHIETKPPKISDYPEFTFIGLPDKLPAGCDFAFLKLYEILYAINTNCQEPLKQCVAEMMENPTDNTRVACIIYDMVLYFGDAVAKELKIPSFVFRSNNAAFMQASRALARLHKENGIPIPGSRLQEPVPELETLRFKDLPLPIARPLPEFLLQYQATITDTRSSVGIIWNTTDELEHSLLLELEQHFQVPFFPIGPFHKMVPASKAGQALEDDNSKKCIAWLNKQAPRSVLYVSLGTLATMDQKEFIEMAWGLANSDQPFLWVVRSSSINGSNWLENLPEEFSEKVGERGLIVDGAPQKQVLSHVAVGGFWSHCGWNSTLESISEGVPMICRPYFSDQMVNARYLSHVWKVGVLVEDQYDRVTFEKAIRKVLVDEEGKEIRDRAIQLKEKHDACVQGDGSSCKSLNDLTELIASFSAKK